MMRQETTLAGANLANGAGLTSILSYPVRGEGGRASWRGNMSPLMVKDLLGHYRPQNVTDAASGGATTQAVCQQMNIECFGFDLYDEQSFNLLKDSLAERIQNVLRRQGREFKGVDYGIFHPPYHDMIDYSEQWKKPAHPDDLSRCKDYADFVNKMAVALDNYYDALRAGGNYSVLIGDMRRKGQYISMQADILQIAPGELDGICIKEQHNVVSSRRAYTGRFIPIAHEYLLNFRKPLVVFGIIERAVQTSQRMQRLSEAVFDSMIKTVMRDKGGYASISDIAETIERTMPDNVRDKPHWRDKIRRLLSTRPEYQKTERRGVWTLELKPKAKSH